MSDRYAVIGNPIHHSKSPLIHTAFAQQTDQDIEYSRIEVTLDTLTSQLEQLQQQGFKGLNVTVPFKEQVWQYIKDKSPHALKAGAVNTITFKEDGRLFGDNTDGIGLCNDLINHQINLKQKRILLLGAGGAARGVIAPLLNHQPSELVIANRTVSKAQTLADLFSDAGSISASGFSDLRGRFDLIINATSASLQGDVPPISQQLLTESTCCYDMMYSQLDTAFIAWAKQQGSQHTIDGLGMLVEQAAEAFYLWRGVRPDTRKVIEQLKKL